MDWLKNWLVNALLPTGFVGIRLMSLVRQGITTLCAMLIAKNFATTSQAASMGSTLADLAAGILIMLVQVWSHYHGVEIKAVAVQAERDNPTPTPPTTNVTSGGVGAGATDVTGKNQTPTGGTQ